MLETKICEKYDPLASSDSADKIPITKAVTSNWMLAYPLVLLTITVKFTPRFTPKILGGADAETNKFQKTIFCEVRQPSQKHVPGVPKKQCPFTMVWKLCGKMVGLVGRHFGYFCWGICTEFFCESVLAVFPVMTS